jgi:hypothetical protein
MKTYQGRRCGRTAKLESGGKTWEYLTVSHATSRMRSAVKAMTEEKSRRIRDFGGLLNQVGSAAITLDLNEAFL